MKRPYLVNFIAIAAYDQISVRMAVSDSGNIEQKAPSLKTPDPTSPMDSIGLFSSDQYRIEIIGLDNDLNEVYAKEFDSDSFGNFDLRFKRYRDDREITKLQIYETSYRKGLALHLGTYLVATIEKSPKVLISDFDKTLVDTKYSTPKEMYYSLNRPMSYFPTVAKSVDLVKRFIDDEHYPFILSASPHFYERVLRDWLYQNQIYAGHIFLKDYRKIFSLSEGILSTKDINRQGFYKLNQLVTILLMTSTPKELVLIGDSFESDELIYLTLASILIGRMDPWRVWQGIKNEKSFSFTVKQDFQFLSKFYHLGELAKKYPIDKLSIFIRCRDDNYHFAQERMHKYEELNKYKKYIEYYIA